VREILAFEVMSSTEWATPLNMPFIPNVFVNIGDYLTKKRKALAAYDMEMHPAPHSRSLEHVDFLARYRENNVGVEAAEAFEVCRVIR